MNPILRNIIAVVVAFVAAYAINMGMLVVGMKLIPPPDGVNVMDPENLKANIHLFKLKHFLPPFLAHALSTLVAAFLAALIAATHKMKFAIAFGVLNLLGGIAAAFMIPAPAWFIAFDLIVAYLPMAWVGGKLGQRFSS